MKNMFKNLSDIVKHINQHPLAGKHRFLAYYKFLKWQISQFPKPKEKKIKFTDKALLLVKKGMTGATGNIYLGLHEFNDMSFLLHFLQPKDIFFDIGANIGSYTILASAHCKAQTFCFEPVPTTFATLQKNITVNNIEHLVTASNIGIGEKQEELLFTKTMDTVNHVIAKSDTIDLSKTIMVKIETADSMLTRTACPILIKIDVEGFETSVLNGMPNILQNENLKGIIIELNGCGFRYGYDDDAIHKKLLSFNFRPYLYNPFARSLEILSTYGQFNTIYIRDISFIKNRIIKAEKVKLFSESF